MDVEIAFQMLYQGFDSGLAVLELQVHFGDFIEGVFPARGLGKDFFEGEFDLSARSNLDSNVMAG